MEAKEAALAAAARTFTSFGPSPGLPAALTAASCSASDGGSDAQAPVGQYQAGGWTDTSGARQRGQHPRGYEACGLGEAMRICWRRVGVWGGVGSL